MAKGRAVPHGKRTVDEIIEMIRQAATDSRMIEVEGIIVLARSSSRNDRSK